MFLSEPQTTQLDLNFRLFGVPVRVHPLFWVLAAVISYRDGDLPVLLLGMVVIFVSILVHEFGHVLAYRYYGRDAEVVLHMFGGLAIARGGGLWGRQASRSGRAHHEAPWPRVVISFAGPLAGFILAAATLGAVYLSRDVVRWDAATLFGVPWPVWDPPYASFLFNGAIARILLVNVVWGVFNLLPIYPLDGGQISRALFTLGMRDTFEGVRRSLWLSIATVVGLVALEYTLTGSGTSIMMLALLGVGNFQELQAYQGWGRRW